MNPLDQAHLLELILKLEPMTQCLSPSIYNLHRTPTLLKEFLVW